MDVDTVFAIDASPVGVSVKKSTKAHLDAGLDLFAFMKIEKDEMVVYCYGFLIYSNLTNERQAAKTYGEGLMQVTAGMF